MVRSHVLGRKSTIIGPALQQLSQCCLRLQRSGVGLLAPDKPLHSLYDLPLHGRRRGSFLVGFRRRTAAGHPVQRIKDTISVHQNFLLPVPKLTPTVVFTKIGPCIQGEQWKRKELARALRSRSRTTTMIASCCKRSHSRYPDKTKASCSKKFPKATRAKAQEQAEAQGQAAANSCSRPQWL